ncbi:MAG TPA: hypothetical protein VM285_05535, partial [Polyangia bacterium]|nr:hypothetical protein [Polyangia bacterium]
GSYGSYWPNDMGECLGDYWSQSQLETYNHAAWYVRFGTAEIGVLNKYVNEKHVRCVRGDSK